MASPFESMVHQLSSTAPGTGSVSLPATAASAGRRTFLAAFGNGGKVQYFIEGADGSEWGWGTITGTTTGALARDTVVGNSDGTTSKINFTGIVNVWCGRPAESFSLVSTKVFDLAGTSTAYTLTDDELPPTFDGMAFLVRFDEACGDNPTFNPNGEGAADFVKSGGDNLAANDAKADDVLLVVKQPGSPTTWALIGIAPVPDIPGRLLKTDYVTSTNASYPRPSGASYYRARLIGGGGGGGSSESGANNTIGGGGQAGGEVITDILSAPSTLNITIGTAGTGGTHPSSKDGGAGGDTIVDDGTNTFTAGGGAGGLEGGNATKAPASGGGSASGGVVNIDGEPGSRNGGSTQAPNNGTAGSTSLGKSGKSQIDTTPTVSTGYGAGGAGGWRTAANANGRDGRPGIVIIEWYS